jgi:hypothetical protein
MMVVFKTNLFSILQKIQLKRYYFTPNFERKNKFSKVSLEDIEYFKNILGNDEVIINNSDPELFQSYNIDWMHKYHGKGSLVLRPKNTQQVSQIL